MIPVKSEFPPGVVAVLTGELTRYARFMQDLAALQIPAGSSVAWVFGPSVKRNMDELFSRFLDATDKSWIWIIGDDHTFPGTMVLDVLGRHQECVVPLCLTRTPPIRTTIQKSGVNVGLLDLPRGGLLELKEDEVCGDAGMLLSRRVVLASGPPWQDGPATGSWDVEDRGFCQKIQRLGVRVWVDLDHPLGHITPTELVPQHTENGWKVAHLIAEMEVT